MSTRIHIDVDVPADLVEAIAEQIVERLGPGMRASEEWLTTGEAAAYLRRPTSRIYALSRSGQIPVHRDGSRLLFRRSELDGWVVEGGGKRS